MGWWSEQVVPRLTDKALDLENIHEHRARVCAGLAGEVLEIGFGSGLNIRHYPHEVTGVCAVEPSDVAWRRSRRDVRRGEVTVERGGLDGQRLDLPDDAFDAALSTFTMCTIPDLDAALAEIRRVLRPGGRLHFLEHGLSPDARVATWQRRLTPLQRRVLGGCHLDRPVVERLEGAGFHVEHVDELYGAGPRVTSYLSLGTARASV